MSSEMSIILEGGDMTIDQIILSIEDILENGFSANRAERFTEVTGPEIIARLQDYKKILGEKIKELQLKDDFERQC